MKFSGYIEGFYGRIFDKQTRINLARKIFDIGLNTYLYAPKEDPKHRILWRKEYDSDEQEHFAEIIRLAKAKNAQFIPAIAPGLSFEYTESDYSILAKKIRFFVDLGVEYFALTMDDIPTTSPIPKAKLGNLHGEILCKIKNDFPALNLIFCPTIYADDLVDDSSLFYLDDLKNSAPKNIIYLWTGDSTISKEINANTMKHASKVFGKDIIIWDNFYCNDYCPNRIFVGQYEGRDLDFLQNETSGVLINCSGLPLTDEINLQVFSRWISSEKSTKKEIEAILLKFGVPQNLLNYLPLISSPYKQDYTLPKTYTAEEFMIKIIAKWQSPLKMEWYAALHAMFTALRVQNAKEPFSAEWYGMRYIKFGD